MTTPETPPAAFDALASILALIADAPASKARLLELRQAEQSATLLRGASVPSQTAGGRELLHPATQVENATPPDQLLRPIN